MNKSLQKMIFIFVLLFSLTSCISLEKREKYNTFYNTDIMPYYPTYTVYNENVIAKRNFLLISIIGIPYVILDYIGSTIIDTVMLPFDIYRNNVTIPKRIAEEEDKKNYDYTIWCGIFNCGDCYFFNELFWTCFNFSNFWSDYK